MKKIELLEPEIGEVFKYERQSFKCIKTEHNRRCEKCAFEHFGECLKVFACEAALRQDSSEVYFVPAEQKHSCFVVDIPEKPLDVPVDRAAEVDGDFYRCTPGMYCKDCDITGTGVCGMLKCIGSDRADNTSVVFKKIETTKI